MQPREPGPVLRGDLEGWGGREEVYVYIQLIHMVVQQKLTQLCEAIILPPKKICSLRLDSKPPPPGSLPHFSVLSDGQPFPVTLCNSLHHTVSIYTRRVHPLIEHLFLEHYNRCWRTSRPI